MPPTDSQEGVLKDLALNLSSITCMEPLLVQHFYNSWGKYCCRTQPVSPGSALCSPEVDLNFLRSPKPSLQYCGQHPRLPQCCTRLPQYLYFCCYCPAGNSISLLTAAPGRDAGLMVGQSECQEPPPFGSPLPSPNLAWPIPIFFLAAALSSFPLLFPTSGRLLDCLAPFISMIPPGKLVNRGV